MTKANLVKAEATNVEPQSTAVVEVSEISEIFNPSESSTSDSKPSDSDNSVHGAELFPATPSSNDEADGSHILSDHETPKANIFNPFAPPASGKILFAPIRKISREFKKLPCRKLDFDSCVSPVEEKPEFDDEDELILQSLTQSFLDLIIRNQSNAVPDDPIDENSDVFTTPAAVLRLTGTADRCPDAPLKSGPKSRMPESDLSMCRKLDFESC